ncbi:methionine-S-sulfoxide reductase [Halobacteroides halobius DSM 5150]|uniref:Peptide methionine sulfoxide reductase MsrA n=1 Tax=Halobacteroides halobius (strain ATCC 35273 / DSM 5150 / MD-1) TaxID=748449 RepID=L0K924_HALHC|nr:peptide-methionine (S)-S-oxide reductase MsrA [Halobacteroides halobius]AGB40839.1 methionine-S-sulfoxide reductase [Halobacteroides halobius DSM 5150]
MEKATFAAGCFWGVQALFDRLEGVESTRVGYIGGNIDNPSYEEVCTDKTGHAEAVEIIYNSSIITYQQLLEVFWENHNPTTLNKEGSDVGTQYRSAIFYHNQKQQKKAQQSKKELNASGRYDDPIVTEIISATNFYEAEEYHQDYLKKNPGSCHI